MTDQIFGIWNAERGCWSGLGVDNTFSPFTATSIEEGRQRYPDASTYKPMTPENLIEGLPYPDAAKIGARVEWDDGHPKVIMDPNLPWEIKPPPHSQS